VTYQFDTAFKLDNVLHERPCTMAPRWSVRRRHCRSSTPSRSRPFRLSASARRRGTATGASGRSRRMRSVGRGGASSTRISHSQCRFKFSVVRTSPVHLLDN